MASSRQLQRLNAHLQAAKAYAQLSYAKRLKVGAVLVREDRVISVGYNGTPSGFSNVCEESFTNIYSESPTKKEVVHAEMNCIAFAAKNGIATDGATLIITHSPCFECCKLLVQAGIKEVFYDLEYRDKSGLEVLRQAKIRLVCTT